MWVSNVFRPRRGKIIIGPNFHYVFKVHILLLQHVGQPCPHVYVKPNVLP